MKSIILCADDYGQTNAISQAIIQLLQHKRLTATSCLVTSPLWREHAPWLKACSAQADIGVHFNLTEGRPLSQAALAQYGEKLPGLSRLLMDALLRKIEYKTILSELNAQIDEFMAGYGELPAYIDGHQHVHQLPVIRDAVLAVYDQRLRQKPGSYVRSVFDQNIITHPTRNAYLKRCIIQLCGASVFKKQLLQRKIPHNASFSGIYSFRNSKSYSQIFLTFLNQISDNGLVMCHPGLEASDSHEDQIYGSRPDEYQYLISPAFLEACHKHQVTLKTFSSL